MFLPNKLAAADIASTRHSISRGMELYSKAQLEQAYDNSRRFQQLHREVVVSGVIGVRHQE
jgi:hypothetical protein